MEDPQERAELLERAQLLQQAKQIQASKKAAAGANTPPPQTFGDNLKAQLPSADDLANAGSAAVQGFGQGASLGYLPQMQAAIEPMVNKIGDAITGKDVYDTMGNYTQRRDEASAHLAKVQNDNPKSFVGGALAGGLTTGLAVPGGALAEGTGLAAKTAASVGSGVAMRALQNPGDKTGELDPLQTGQRLSNMSDLKSLAIDAAVPLVGPALSGAGNAAANVAQRAGFKSLGPYARQAMQSMSKGEINSVGQTLLDTGAIGGMPKSYENLAKKISDLKNESGQRLGQTVEQMSQAENGMGSGAQIGLSRNQIGNDLEKTLISPNLDVAGIPEKNAKLSEYIANWKRGGLPADAAGPINDQLPLLQAEMKKRGTGDSINWNRLPDADIPVNEEFNRALYGKLRSGVEDGGEQLAQKTGFDVDAFKDQKNEFGNLATAENIANQRARKEFANRMISPSDYGVGIVAGGAGLLMPGASPEDRMKHGAMGLLAGLANHGARKYGNQLMSMGANNASQLANGLGTAASALSSRPIGSAGLSNAWNTLYNNQNQSKDQK